MTTRKGESMLLRGLAFVIGVAVIGGAIFYGLQASTAPDQEVTYEGQFNQLQTVQELTGYNDLSVSTVNLNESNTAATFVTKNNLNSTNGQTSRLVYGINVDGAINDVDVEMTTPTALSGDEFIVEEVKLVQDSDDDLSISEAPVEATFTADGDGEFDRQGIGPIEDGDYAFVLKITGSNADTLSGGEDLFNINWDAAEAEADGQGSDEVQVTIQNAN